MTFSTCIKQTLSVFSPYYAVVRLLLHNITISPSEKKKCLICICTTNTGLLACDTDG